MSTGPVIPLVAWPEAGGAKDAAKRRAARRGIVGTFIVFSCAFSRGVLSNFQPERRKTRAARGRSRVSVDSLRAPRSRGTWHENCGNRGIQEVVRMNTDKSLSPSLALALVAALAAAAGCSAKPKAVAPPETVKAAEASPRVVPVPAENPVPPPPAPPAVERLPSDLDEMNRKGYLTDAFFDFDRFDLDAADREALSKDAAWLGKWGSVQVILEGHCDERGTAAYNMALGEKRAQATRDYLVSLGVSADRVKVVSFGSEKPLAVGHDEQSWAQNRRGHFVIAAR
jgi:peptidoglycan-associated lipoprotein